MQERTLMLARCCTRVAEAEHVPQLMCKCSPEIGVARCVAFRVQAPMEVHGVELNVGVDDVLVA